VIAGSVVAGLLFSSSLVGRSDEGYQTAVEAQKAVFERQNAYTSEYNHLCAQPDAVISDDGYVYSVERLAWLEPGSSGCYRSDGLDRGIRYNLSLMKAMSLPAPWTGLVTSAVNSWIRQDVAAALRLKGGRIGRS